MYKKILIVEDEFIIADVLRDMLQNTGYEVCGIADTVEEALELIEREKPGFVLLDIFLKGKLSGIDLAHQLTEKNIPFIYLSANSNKKVLEAAKKTNPYGFVVKPFREKDVLIAIDIAQYRYENNLVNTLRQNAVMQKTTARIMSSAVAWDQKIMDIGKALQPYIPFEYLSVGLRSLNNGPYNEIGFLRIGYEEYQVIRPKELMTITGMEMQDLNTLKANTATDLFATWYIDDELLEAFKTAPLKKLISGTFSLKSHLVLPISLAGGKVFYFYFYSRRPDAYHADHIILCDRFEQLLANFAEKMLAIEGNPLISESRSGLISRSEEEGDNHDFFHGIIGNSHLLLNVFDNIIRVAPSDSSVLILGESGTGKEKIADRIHHLSPRKLKPFIKVNCAALPAALIDSELFGHEKGSFTGAYERKIGRFEQAHTGTIFLDEIGEIPLELQVKLLRVLQEKEIERIGGRTTIKTDVRIIAATNRDLEKEVAEGRFRLDLYYRLNVFPIVMPPLRDRKEDIPALAKHFLNIYNRKTGKMIIGFSERVMEHLKNYNWPGNIRELENLIERNVLLAREETIENIVLPTMSQHLQYVPVMAEADIKTMSENEREHIMAALKKCNGKIWGEGGAADLLNLPPTTLNSKMKKLGIKKNFVS